MKTVETIILQNLVHDENYMRKVMPFIKADYFTNSSEKLTFDLIQKFIEQYNKPPTLEALFISLQNTNLPENQFKEVSENLKLLEQKEKTNIQWLVDETEKFCKDKAVYNAILKSINVLEGNEKALSKDGIPSLLQDALGVSFDNSVGHDYFDDSDKRFEYYHRVEERIPFDLELFNKITKGGLPNKTLNIALT